MNKQLLAVITLILIACVALVLGLNRKEDATSGNSQTPSTNSQSTSQANPNQSTSSSIPGISDKGLTTLAEVKKHNNKNDCWTIISSAVYDITEYINSHPGGDEILRACGTDATSMFVSRKTNDGEAIGSGEPHSSNARSILGKYRIGELNQE